MSVKIKISGELVDIADIIGIDHEREIGNKNAYVFMHIPFEEKTKKTKKTIRTCAGCLLIAMLRKLQEMALLHAEIELVDDITKPCSTMANNALDDIARRDPSRRYK